MRSFEASHQLAMKHRVKRHCPSTISPTLREKRISKVMPTGLWLSPIPFFVQVWDPSIMFYQNLLGVSLSSLVFLLTAILKKVPSLQPKRRNKFGHPRALPGGGLVAQGALWTSEASVGVTCRWEGHLSNLRSDLK